MSDRDSDLPEEIGEAVDRALDAFIKAQDDERPSGEDDLEPYTGGPDDLDPTVPYHFVDGGAVEMPTGTETESGDQPTNQGDEGSEAPEEGDEEESQESDDPDGDSDESDAGGDEGGDIGQVVDDALDAWDNRQTDTLDREVPWSNDFKDWLDRIVETFAKDPLFRDTPNPEEFIRDQLTGDDHTAWVHDWHQQNALKETGDLPGQDVPSGVRMDVNYSDTGDGPDVHHVRISGTSSY